LIFTYINDKVFRRNPDACPVDSNKIISLPDAFFPGKGLIFDVCTHQASEMREEMNTCS